MLLVAKCWPKFHKPILLVDARDFWAVLFIIFGPEWKTTTVWCFHGACKWVIESLGNSRLCWSLSPFIMIWNAQQHLQFDHFTRIYLRAIFKQNLCKYKIDSLTTACVVCSMLSLSVSFRLSVSLIIWSDITFCVVSTDYSCLLRFYVYYLHFFLFAPHFSPRLVVDRLTCVYTECNRLTFSLKCWNGLSVQCNRKHNSL